MKIDVVAAHMMINRGLRCLPKFCLHYVWTLRRDPDAPREQVVGRPWLERYGLDDFESSADLPDFDARDVYFVRQRGLAFSLPS